MEALNVLLAAMASTSGAVQLNRTSMLHMPEEPETMLRGRQAGKLGNNCRMVQV